MQFLKFIIKTKWLIAAIILGALMIVCGLNYSDNGVVCGAVCGGCAYLCLMMYMYEKRK